MEALIPKLFIITAEASIVLFLLLIIIIVFNSKAKRRDISTANELVTHFVNNKNERITVLKNQMQNIGIKENTDEKAEHLYNQEKSLIKKFITLYLRRDTYRLRDYPENVMDVTNHFLKTSSSGDTPKPDLSSNTEVSSSEANANATIMAREQVESNEVHLKELSELRLKNTELNEQLFEALETITALMTEHGKKTGQEVDINAQKILEAIISLRDQRLGKEIDPSKLAPPHDEHDQMQDPWQVDLTDNDMTLDDGTEVNLGISDDLNTDLDTLDEAEDTIQQNENLTDAEMAELNLDETSDEADPLTDALEEQAQAETSSSGDEAEPWGDALAEQAQAETSSSDEEADPWADALAEQAQAETSSSDEEADPWADALAEQAQAETSSSDEEADPWADALAEQEKSEKK